MVSLEVAQLEDLLDELLAVAKELARLATAPGNPAPFSIGTQTDKLDKLEMRILLRRATAERIRQA